MLVAPFYQQAGMVYGSATGKPIIHFCNTYSLAYSASHQAVTIGCFRMSPGLSPAGCHVQPQIVSNIRLPREGNPPYLDGAARPAQDPHPCREMGALVEVPETRTAWHWSLTVNYTQ